MQHCCKMSWKAMLRVLSLTLKTVNNPIWCKTGLMWVVIRAKSLFNWPANSRRISGRRSTSSYKGEKRRPEMRLLFPGYYSTRFTAMLQNKLHDFWCPFFRTWKGICTIASFYSYYQNPSGFCFLKQIRAFIILTSRDLKKGKDPLNSVLSSKKRCHRAKGLLML